MADAAGLKHMVMSFRVSELQVLLGYAGRNKSGRKGELIQRALQLVQKGCSMPIQIKIRELYRALFISSLTPLAAVSAITSSSGTSNRSKSIFQKSSSSNSSLCWREKSVPRSRGSPMLKLLMTTLKCLRSQVRAMQPDSGSNIPVHPDVKLKRLPFYDIQGELLKPTSLVPRGSSRFQETHFVFHLTPQQAQDIAMSRDFRPGAKCEYNTQVQLRFCLLETSCEQDDNFPPSICVRVNGKTTPLPNPIPTTKPGVEPKRPGRPVDITSQCRLSPTMPNYVDISWASEYPRGYCVAIYLVKKLTSDILLQRLKQFGNRHPDHTRALIKEKLSHDPDSEIATTSLRVSLTCPLGKMRIQIPCRASTCSHLQCFDASTYMCMNEKKPTWTCPVCDKPAPFHKLMIDGLFVEICRQASEYNDIQFVEDGSWSPLKQNKETHLISSPSPVIKHSPSSPVSKKSKQDVIDLTLSSSDEEDEDRTTPKNVINAGIVRVLPRTPPGPPPLLSMESNLVPPPGFPCPISMQTSEDLEQSNGLNSLMNGLNSDNFIAREQQLYSMGPQFQGYREGGMVRQPSIPSLQRFKKNSPSPVLSEPEVISLD
ncbi:hypothetical protein ScPMuIL_018964 [Solemya velum]